MRCQEVDDPLNKLLAVLEEQLLVFRRKVLRLELLVG
jgi:hypothetical protein